MSQRQRRAGRLGGGSCLVVVAWLLLGPALAPGAVPEDRARELVERLSSDRWEVRERATRELIEMGRVAHAALREALDSGDAELRYRSRLILEAPARHLGKLLHEAIEQGQAPTWALGPPPFLGPRRTDVSGAALGGRVGVMAAVSRRGLGGHAAELRRLDWMLAEPLISVIGRWTHAAEALESRSGLSADERSRLLEFRHGVQLAAWMLGEVWRSEDVATVIDALCLLPLEHHASLEDLVAALPDHAVGGLLAQVAADKQVGAPVKARAVRLLGFRLGAQRPEASGAVALEVLVKALRDPQAVVRREAVEALLRVAPPPGVVGGELVAAVAVEPSAILRERMVSLAGVLGERSAEPPLAALLGDAAVDVALRVVAARALGNLAPLGPAVLDTLRSLVGDESEPQELREAAVTSLGAMGDRAVVGLLARMLAQGADDLDPQVLLRALGRIGGAEAVEVLRGITASSEPVLPVEAVRALGLARRSPREAGEVLRDLLTKGTVVMQVAAVQAAGDLGHGPTMDLVVRHLRSRDRLVREALTAVTAARLPRAVDALTTLLKEQRAPQEVRAEAVNALSMIRSPHAQPALRRVIGSSTSRPALRLAAARALSRCGDPGAMGSVLADNARRSGAAGRSSYQLNARGIDYLYARDFARAVSAFRSMLRSKHRDNVAHYNIACAFALAGDRSRALQYLWRAVRSGFDDPTHMDRDPDLDPLRGDRRFEVLMRYSRGIVTARGGSGG